MRRAREANHQLTETGRLSQRREITAKAGVAWFRSGTLSNVTPTTENVGGVDYYVATLQFADTGRNVPATVDYTTLRGFVLTAGSSQELGGEIPEPATLALVGLGGLAILRRRRR